MGGLKRDMAKHITSCMAFQPAVCLGKCGERAPSSNSPGAAGLALGLSKLGNTGDCLPCLAYAVCILAGSSRQGDEIIRIDISYRKQL